jgi:hypothetical protein
MSAPGGTTVLVRAKVIEPNGHVHYSSMFTLVLDQTLFEQISYVIQISNSSHCFVFFLIASLFLFPQNTAKGMFHQILHGRIRHLCV